MAAAADVQRSLSDLPEQTLATLQEVPMEGMIERECYHGSVDISIYNIYIYTCIL